MINKKVLKTKAKAKSKLEFKSKVKAKKVTKKISKKIKNPVNLSLIYRSKAAYNKYLQIRSLESDFATVHSNTGIIYGFLTSRMIYYSPSSIMRFDEKDLEVFNRETFTLTSNFHNMPNRDDLSLIAENNDYLGNDLFWEEYDEFRKDKFKKSTDYQFTLGNVDKVDVENNRIYVRRLKEIKSKND